MGDGTGFELLGPVRLWSGGDEVALGPAKQRCVLAVLLMRPNWPVPAAGLIERVWGEWPPKSPQAPAPYVTRLRKLLPPGLAELRYDAGGYRLDCDPALVDLHRARQLADRARVARAAGEHELAAELLHTAVSGWSAEPLAGLRGGWATQTRAALAAEGRQLRVARAEINLHLRRYAEVVDELRPVLADQPWAEDVAAPLMRALAHSGRPADALNCYSRVRAALAGELGLDPSPDLADLQVAILRGRTGGHEPAPAVAAPPAPEHASTGDDPPEPPPGREVPAELPADVAAFTGRDAELAAVDRLLAPAETGALPIVAVSGTAGVGKTALVLHWAHRARDRFPDGQLYLNLRGYDPDRPVRATDALARLLSSLGVPDRDIPPELDERATRYRSLLARRRALVVLDNAASVDQVRPLLPGTPSCPVLVTSRDSLSGLVIRDGARRLVLDLLPLPAAVTLLGRLLGPLAADPDVTAALAQRCSRLPLALRIAAELAAGHPDLPLDRLIDGPPGLDRLAVDGDPRTAVRTVFSWSLRHLPEPAARAFSLLGVHPGAELEPYALAALTGADLPASRHALDRLAAAHLVQPLGADRYGMHDLLRIYAAELADGQRPAALDRLLDYYLATAATAVHRLFPALARYLPPVPAPAGPLPPLPDPAAARAWLDRELPILTDTAGYAAGHDRPDYPVTLSALLFRYLTTGSHLIDGQHIHQHALHAATAGNDLAGQAQAHIGLGGVAMEQGRYDPAARHMRRAQHLFEQVGDALGAARARSNLGIIADRQGRYADAAVELTAAHALHGQAGDRAGQSRALNNLGNVQLRLGQFDRAISAYTTALRTARDNDDLGTEAEALNNLGSVLGQLRRPEALDHLHRALDLSTRIGDRYNQAQSLDSLASAELALGHTTDAVTHYTAALDLFRGIGHRDAETWVLNGLGEAALATGDPRTAISHHADALGRATEHDIPDQQARAHRGLATAYRTLGDHPRSRHHYHHALRLYTTLGSPEAETISTDLTALRD
jgi:tetratricopeptide (TPR) repeat protein